MTFPIRPSLLLGALMLAANVAALESDRQKELVVEADQLEGSEQTQTTRLTGDVRLTQGTLNIHAETAILHGPVKSLERLIVEGDPARLSQQMEDRQGELNAQANRIDYDLAARQIVLSGGAVVDQGNRRLTGERIEYDLANDRVIGQGAGEPDGERVRIRIEPDAESDG